MLAAALLAVLVAGCVLPDQAGESAPAKPARDEIAKPDSPWLNPEARIDDALRLRTPCGIDLRQAAYVLPEGEEQPAALLLLRDYSDRRTDRPDAQTAALLALDTGTSSMVETNADIYPFAATVSGSKRGWVLASADYTDAATADEASVMLTGGGELVFAADAEVGERRLPLGFIDDHNLIARRVTAMQLDNGLLAASLDWQGPAQRYHAASGQWIADASGLFTANAQRSWLAGYTVDYEPVLPAQSTIVYHAAPPAQSASARQLAVLPYHVSFTAFEWRPPLVWASEHQLATVQFLPAATGQDTRGNYQGLFRLVVTDVRDAAPVLVEDHLPAGLPFAAADGALFYTRQQPADDGTQWELWAASVDGLHKQRLWTTDGDTIYLSVEDQYDAQRLLVHRQMVDLSGTDPELHSELREFSLGPLTGGTIKLDLEPRRAMHEEPAAPAAAGDDLFSLPDGGGPPPISIPD